jgi:ABC-type multidrug transport system fused ATPase/permease subunit
MSGNGETPRSNLGSAYRKLWRLLDRSERRRATLLVALMLVSAVSEVVGVATVMPFIAVLSSPDVVTTNRWFRLVYDTFGFTDQRSFLVAMGLVFFTTLLLSLFVKGFSTSVQFRFAINRSVAWSKRLVAAYLGHPYSWYLTRDTSVLAATILGEVENVVTAALLPAMLALARVLIVLLILALLLTVDPLLAVGAGVVLGGGFAIVSLATRARLQRSSEERLRATRERFTVVQEAFGGIKALKLAGHEQAWLTRFERPLQERARWTIVQSLVEQIPPLLMQAVLFGGLLLILTYLVSSRGSLQDALPVIGLYALAGYRLMPAVQGVFEGLARVRGAEAAIDALAADLRQTEAAAPTPPGGGAPHPCATQPRSITLREVSYRYPAATRAAVQEVSLEIPACSSLGIVGGTGSGKSTLVDLVLGLLEPGAGTIHVDGELLDRGNLREWQRSIGYVPQQIFLTNDSVLANIAFGVPAEAIDRGAVEQAARAANLHEFIVQELAAGYDTPVGERGLNLSGGQRQRLGIARALYHDPLMLVLDEATSALDTVTEQEVMSAIRGLGGRKTIIMVAHRLSTVRDCDSIIVLEGGRIVAAGSYHELLRSNDRFRQLAAAS